jgi:hypothetical protein
MTLMDSFRNYRSTEPIWFRFLRGFFAIVFMMILITYSWIQFKKIDEENYTMFKFNRGMDQARNKNNNFF